MKKLILILSIFFLVIFTTLTKNSSKKLEVEIYNAEENIRSLKNKYEMVLLEFNYLSSPDKLMEYQSKYFENELEEININKLNKISIDNKTIKVEKFLLDHEKNK
mgnify:CR=1 FL=1|tara:strand:+ start:319 stop:633 length:315 start_codon:yes stop_codon:yes gene_type:complete